jgi:hypothetical protein
MTKTRSTTIKQNNKPKTKPTDKTRSTTIKQNNKPKTKPKETKIIAIPQHLIELIAFLHEANKIQFDLTKELLGRMKDDNTNKQ